MFRIYKQKYSHIIHPLLVVCSSGERPEPRVHSLLPRQQYILSNWGRLVQVIWFYSTWSVPNMGALLQITFPYLPTLLSPLSNERLTNDDPLPSFLRAVEGKCPAPKCCFPTSLQSDNYIQIIPPVRWRLTLSRSSYSGKSMVHDNFKIIEKVVKDSANFSWHIISQFAPLFY